MSREATNVLYHSAVLSGINVGYALKFDKGDPSKAGIESILKLAGTAATDNFTKDYLEKMKILPPDIPTKNKLPKMAT
jgi:hypothetical protein